MNGGGSFLRFLYKLNVYLNFMPIAWKPQEVNDNMFYPA
jgi:hypothetical protein